MAPWSVNISDISHYSCEITSPASCSMAVWGFRFRFDIDGRVGNAEDGDVGVGGMEVWWFLSGWSFFIGLGLVEGER